MSLDGLVSGNAALFHDGVDKVFRQNVHFAVRSLYNCIADVGMKGDADVAGKGPGRRGPDEEIKLFLVKMRKLSLVVVHRELHIDRVNRVFVVFNLGLGPGGLVMIAPVDRLQTLVDMAVAVHFPEDADFVRLKAGVHGEVGVFPVTDDAEALEAFHLFIDVLLGIVMAGTAEIRGGHLFVVQLLLLDNGAFNRHAVVVPAGNIGDPAAAHHVAAVDEVLQGLVQGVAHMDVAVGKRRAVMQREERLALVLFQLQVIEIHFFPAFEHLGLAFRQSCAHGKIGFRQIQGGIIVFGHKHSPAG